MNILKIKWRKKSWEDGLLKRQWKNKLGLWSWCLALRKTSFYFIISSRSKIYLFVIASNKNSSILLCHKIRETETMAARGAVDRRRGEGETESNFQVSFFLCSGRSSPFCALFSVSSTTEQALDWKCGIRVPAPLSLQFALDIVCVLRQGLDSTCVSAFIHLQLWHLGHLLSTGQRPKTTKVQEKNGDRVLLFSEFILNLGNRYRNVQS